MIERNTVPGAQVRSWRSRIQVLLSAVLGATVVACGGSGGMGAGASGAQTPGSSIVAVGTITGFGSVHLNGLKFETTGAVISVDGRSGVQGDLRAGDIIEVKGHHDASSGKDVADAIEFRANVQGAVSSIDSVGHLLVVLGQSVLVSADTSFSDNIVPASIMGIGVGDLLKVSGLPAADGTLHAFRIEKQPLGAPLQVIGTASSTSAGSKTFMINALVVNFDAATLVDFPSGDPKDGDLVQVNGTALDGSGALQATRVELRKGKELEPEANGRMELEGLITRFASVTDFDVAGRPVTTSPSTVFEAGAVSDLALGVQIEAEGSVSAAGVLAATRIQIGAGVEDRISAQVDSVDATTGNLVVLGIPVTADAMTRFEDHGAQAIDTFSLANVHTGDWLEIRGMPVAGSRPAVRAARIDRVQPQDRVILTGAVETVASPNFTILSTTIATTTGTQFSNGLDAAGFLSSAVGTLVSVRGRWDGSLLTAEQVQFGEDEQD